MSLSTDKNRIARLAEDIIRYRRLYEQGKPEISDFAYDAMEQELASLAPDHPVLQQVGSLPAGTGAKVQHATPMLSLGKTYDWDDLLSWVDAQPVVGMWKVDGNSLSLIYRQGRLSLGKTRGNGRVGEDVTDKVTWVDDIPRSLPIAAEFEIRGELYCTRQQFALLADQMLAMGLERPTNPRNIVSGLLGRKAHKELARYFNFFAFDLLADDPALRFATEMDKFAWFGEHGFRLPEPQLLRGESEVQGYLDRVKRLMNEGEIGLDGAVFVYDDTAVHARLGNTSHHPRYKLSFKWQGQTAEAHIRTIDWATSRLGIVTPVAVIDPVTLSGAQITNITLHNALHVKTYNLKAGDLIEIVRSGEVIPKFLEVKQAAPGEFQWPSHCPSCETTLVFDGVRLKCPNMEGCPAQHSGTILNWIRAVEIDDLSEKRLESLIGHGLVRGIPDLYTLTVEDFLRLPLTKEKMAKKLHENIAKTRRMPLARFLNGLGIEGAGLVTWEKLLERFHDLPSLRRASQEDIVAIDGFAEKSARDIVEGLKVRGDLIDAILAAGVVPEAPTPVQAAASHPLSGKQIAITGALSQPRASVEALMKKLGVKPASSVSKHTYALVSNETDSGSSKMAKARELGIPIWTEDDLMAALQQKD